MIVHTTSSSVASRFATQTRPLTLRRPHDLDRELHHALHDDPRLNVHAHGGYAEVGRVPGSIRVEPGDDRDSVLMARRLDAAPLRAHGAS